MPAERSFTLTIDGAVTQILFTTPQELRQRADVSSAFLTYDSNTLEVWPPHGQPHAVLPAGEAYKSPASMEQLAAQLLEAGLSRESRVAAVGGGVVCDLTALTASLYMRGIALTLVPTTLLAMVDASMGGKTGVDLRGYKNILGSFYPADTVYIVSDFLQSLPEEEYLGGLAEVIKHALLGDRDLLSMLERHAPEILARQHDCCEELIARSLRVKAAYVEADPYERGIRAHLNLGHTFAHALESCGGLSAYGHGGAVAWGIRKALQLGGELGLTDQDYCRRIELLLDRYGYSRELSTVAPEKLARAMERDKKKAGGEIRFILQRRQGETLQCSVPRPALMRVLEGDESRG